MNPWHLFDSQVLGRALYEFCYQLVQVCSPLTSALPLVSPQVLHTILVVSVLAGLWRLGLYIIQRAKWLLTLYFKLLLLGALLGSIPSAISPGVLRASGFAASQLCFSLPARQAPLVCQRLPSWRPPFRVPGLSLTGTAHVFRVMVWHARGVEGAPTPTRDDTQAGEDLLYSLHLPLASNFTWRVAHLPVHEVASWWTRIRRDTPLRAQRAEELCQWYLYPSQAPRWEQDLPWFDPALPETHHIYHAAFVALVKLAMIQGQEKYPEHDWHQHLSRTTLSSPPPSKPKEPTKSSPLDSAPQPPPLRAEL